MDKIREMAYELKEEILQIPEVKQYLLLLEEIEKNEEIKNLKNEICRLEKLGKKEEKNNLLSIFNSHPLIVNFESSKKEVIPILEQIKQHIL